MTNEKKAAIKIPVALVAKLVDAHASGACCLRQWKFESSPEHQSSQAPIFDRSLKFLCIDISGFFPSIKKFAKTIFKIRLFSAICELLKIAKEFLLKFNTLSIALSTLSPTETNGKI